MSMETPTGVTGSLAYFVSLLPFWSAFRLATIVWIDNAASKFTRARSVRTALILVLRSEPLTWSRTMWSFPIDAARLAMSGSSVGVQFSSGCASSIGAAL
ncbi:hypothetical protein BC831DRAFT_273715 [Entophlyctis helioformis]|nr:hypothetical protein BC831DRAFT_273715 [Entophlyctis helioformis]